MNNNEEENAPNEFNTNTENIDFQPFTEDLKAILKEINYSSTFLENTTKEAGSTMQQVLIDLKKINIDLGKILETKKIQDDSYIKELGKFTLLPEKVACELKNAASDISEKIASKLVNSAVEMMEEFSSLKGELESSITLQQEKLKDITQKIIGQAAQGYTSSCKKLITSLCITCLFASSVAAVTSYLVTTKYPKYVEITGARDVQVQNSQVSVHGAIKK